MSARSSDGREVAAAAASRSKATRKWLRDLPAILDTLDPEGRWISTYNGERLVGQPRFRPGFRYLSSDRFSRNIEALSAFIAASRP